jgi:hypothetical protein
VIAKFGIVKAKHFQRNISRQRRKADAGRNSVRTDRIEHRHAFDRPVRVKVVLRSRRVEGIDGLLVARTGGFRTGSNRRIDAIMIPRDVEPLLARLTLNSRCANKSGQRAGRIRAAGKSHDVNLVAVLVTFHKRLIGVLDDLLQPEPDRSPQQVF